MKCYMCGEEIDFRFVDSVSELLRKRQLCHTDNFWLEKARLVHEEGYRDRVVRVNGTHYIIGEEKDSGGFRGYGGHEFVIRFKDGREVTTTNLWCQGEIPFRWQGVLQNNAEFIQS